jgi:hypothetical protein
MTVLCYRNTNGKGPSKEYKCKGPSSLIKIKIKVLFPLWKLYGSIFHSYSLEM